MLIVQFAQLRMFLNVLKRFLHMLNISAMIVVGVPLVRGNAKMVGNSIMKRIQRAVSKMQMLVALAKLNQMELVSAIMHRSTMVQLVVASFVQAKTRL